VTKVLFVCVANSGRSVMAERLFRRDAGDRHAARSAGSAPGAAAHEEVLAALAEVGIDASDHVPHGLNDEAIDWADVVVATCDDACPVVPGKHYVNWQLPDPKARPLEEVRTSRDEIAFLYCLVQPRRGDAINVRLQLRPALEPVRARQHELRVMQREGLRRCAAMVGGDLDDSVW